MQIGSEMAALQEKNPKMDPKKRFFWKIPQDFELLKKVPQNINQTGQFGWNRYIGIWNLSHGAFQGSVYSDEQEQSNLIVHLWDCEVLKCKSCGSKSPIFACLVKRLLPKGMCFYMYSITADLWNIKKYSERIKHQRHICYLSNLIAYLWGTAWVFNIFSGAGVNFELPKSL